MIIISISDLFSNRMLNFCVSSWFIAQMIKLFLHLFATKTLNLKLLTSSGGMPSSHSSIICTLCVCMGIEYGFNSSLFTFAVVMAMIVMYDAMNVRRATGEQAQALNKLIDTINIGEKMQIKLKEVLGHKPTEVLMGAILGIVVGLLY